MATYLVSYDLDRPGPENYFRLESRLMQLKAVKVLYSQWIIEFGANAASLELDFNQYIDISTDSLLIVELNRNVAWNRLMIADSSFRNLIAASAS